MNPEKHIEKPHGAFLLKRRSQDSCASGVYNDRLLSLHASSVSLGTVADNYSVINVILL